jgi:hypothetical protein
MSYGIIEFDESGKPICEICKKSFNRVISHVRQVHNMNEREYKITYGFDLKKGICSKNSSTKTREKTLSNFDKCVSKNLIINGKKYRFVKGSEGRTKEKVSEQTKIRLKQRLKEDYMISAMKESGKKVGNSGLGNLKRWNQSGSQPIN